MRLVYAVRVGEAFWAAVVYVVALRAPPNPVGSPSDERPNGLGEMATESLIIRRSYSQPRKHPLTRYMRRR